MDPVTHFEIPVDDMKRAEKFYEDAFGWTAQAPPGMEGAYAMAMTSETGDDMRPRERGRIDGAFYPREEPDAGTLVTVEVDSIDEALKRVEEAGGEVVQPKSEVMDYGFYARFRDSEGNLLSLWESAQS
ncbi:MAG: VOC family protein [Armatimonadota bacterium]|jgi:predicted enzyme related to lactoylglutathione lyase